MENFKSVLESSEKTNVPSKETKTIKKVLDADFGLLPLTPRSLKGTGYVEKYVNKGSKTTIKEAKHVEEASGMGSALTSVGTFSDINELDREVLTHVYEQYYHKKERKLSKLSKLSIEDYKSKILSVVETNEVSIISGPTGCGKTTQVPQFILDECAKNKTYCNIIVTQPRRIGAISIAKRICEERDWPLGSFCGYKVGLRDITSKDTRLTFVTVGVFLQILLSPKNIMDYTHIILDEVHERNHELDFCLIILKKLMCLKKVKIILMSATAQVVKFSTYFKKIVDEKCIPAPVIHIKSPNKFLLQVYYLDDLASLGTPEINYDEPKVHEFILNSCIKLIKVFDKIDIEYEDRKSVLVFLPGIFEIEDFYNKLKNPKIYTEGDTEYKWFPIPLHSSITSEEQALAFRPAPNGYRKIILATNVAESSITVPDIMFVIDFCLTKVVVSDPITNFSSLQLTWASKANCIQRAGRAGRVMEGRVYRMVHKDFFQSLEESRIPDILRAPLDKLVLQAKLLDMGSPEAVLSLALDPPDLSNIERTILTLKEVGGLLVTSNGKSCLEDGDLTFLGRLMALMPVDIHITRLIVLGYAFSCLNESIIMGAALSLKSVFSSPFQGRLRSYNSKLSWADGSCSDCIAFLNVYDVWRMNHNNGYFKRCTGGGEPGWARRHFIQLRALKEVHILVDELKRRLKSHHIEESVGVGRVSWNDVQKPFVLKFIIAGAFYPNYFARGERGGQVDEESALKLLGGRDPFSTVYLLNFPQNQPRGLYSHLIKEELIECKEDMKISHDGGSKVYVEFRKGNYKGKENEIPFNSEVPGKISMAVYRAVKIGQLQKHIEINALPPDQANEMAEKFGLNIRKNYSDESNESLTEVQKFPPILPDVNVNHISIKITYIDNPGHFWASNKDGFSEKFEKEIFIWLNLKDPDFENYSKLPEVGDMCVAPYNDGEECWLYRGRVDAVKEIDKNHFAQIFFIDYGNSELVPVTDLKKYGPKLMRKIGKIPGRAFECVLTNIKPSSVKDPSGKWCEDAYKKFQSMLDGDLVCNVYSVVGGVVSCILYKIQNTVSRCNQININEILLKEGFAEEAEESCLSKANNAIRTGNHLDFNEKKAYNDLQVKKNFTVSSTFGVPNLQNTKLKIHLKGPFSPLEMKIFSCVRGGASKQINISSSSVNSVLLDADPQDRHERLIVAAHVSQNQNGSILLLNNTTIMPNIRGLAALIPFVFAPTLEMRVNKKRTMYTGILCGLGVDEQGEPLFPEHDMEIVFDCEFTFDDFSNVNRLRFYMSLLLLTDDENKEPVYSESEVILMQSNIKTALMALIDKPRPSQELEFPKKEYKWGLVESNLVIDNPTAMHYSRWSIFPLHAGVSITPKSNLDKVLLRRLDNLQLLIRNKIEPAGELQCDLCEVSLKNLQSIRYHFITPVHKEREKQFRAKFTDSNQ